MLAPQLGQHRDEGPVPMVPEHQAHRKNRLAAAAIQLQAAVWPVREALTEAEGRRMHRATMA